MKQNFVILVGLVIVSWVFLISSTFYILYTFNTKAKKKDHQHYEQYHQGMKDVSDSLEPIRSRMKITGKEFDIWMTDFFVTSATHSCQYTLVTQLSLPRLNRIGFQEERWKECFSIGLFVDLDEYSTRFNSSFQSIYEELSRNFERSSDLRIHLHISNEYKINSLRNFALDNAKTPYVLLVDVDWIVSANIHSTLEKFGPPPPKYAYSLITFTMECSLENPELKFCNVTEFYPHGQHKTDPSHWKIAKEAWDVNFDFPYEPYVVMRRHDVVRYRTRFDFGGNDKVSHMLECSLSGVKFRILPFAYVAHYPHLKVEMWKSRSYERAVSLWHDYIVELRKLYPGQTIRDHYLPWNSKCATETCVISSKSLHGG